MKLREAKAIVSDFKLREAREGERPARAPARAWTSRLLWEIANAEIDAADAAPMWRARADRHRVGEARRREKKAAKR